MKRNHIAWMGAALAAAWTATAAELAVPYPGEAPGAAQMMGERTLGNALLRFEVSPQGQTDSPLSVTTRSGSFTATRVTGLQAAPLQADPRASRAAERLGGQSLSGTWELPGADVRVQWRAELRDGSHYITQRYTITALSDTELLRLEPIARQGEDFVIPGSVPGTPLVQEGARRFYGIEMPGAQAVIDKGGARVGLDCKLPLKAGESVSFTTVGGVYPEGQLRRAFLAYIERERAVPYHNVVQYNCWYDHGLNPTEEKMLATVAAYAEELVRKRGIVPDSFVLDDGWDDFHADLWQPNPAKFPEGFGRMTQAMRAIGSHFGIWISPLGGYSGQTERVAHAKRLGLLPESAGGMDLAEPGYYNWFLGRCRELMQQDGVNFFKWDRAGSGVSPHFMALLRIADELRKVDPQLFLSTTVGTWPSPFWLRFVDCTWRTGSADVSWCGEGNNRERYITHRDQSCYRLIVQRAPLYPLNSLMHHGIVLGTEFQAGYTSDARIDGKDPRINSAEEGGASATQDVGFPVNNDLRRDARLLFATGANQQELYLTPGMMNERAWDDVAEALRWSHRWAPVLADAHWVGGDPGKGNIYGYAAWRGDVGATLALRNPTSREQSIVLSTAIFEPTHARAIRLRAAYPDQRVRELELPAEGTIRLQLAPFEVLVFETDCP